MGTPANQELLASAGLATTETGGATPSDLVLAVDAETDDAAASALAAARVHLEEAQRVRDTAGPGRPRTLETALRRLPDANLVSISVPGEYAKLEALAALRRGLHVFLFSDNVTVADEIELKRLAVSKGLLCMGPDCGTAYLGGVGLGFANAVPPGRVGCIAASGTGLQAVACHLAALGEGISHGHRRRRPRPLGRRRRRHDDLRAHRARPRSRHRGDRARHQAARARGAPRAGGRAPPASPSPSSSARSAPRHGRALLAPGCPRWRMPPARPPPACRDGRGRRARSRIPPPCALGWQPWPSGRPQREDCSASSPAARSPTRRASSSSRCWDPWRAISAAPQRGSTRSSTSGPTSSRAAGPIP